jgi:pimeloyl-ACP methyl ester carboxylesterase
VTDNPAEAAVRTFASRAVLRPLAGLKGRRPPSPDWFRDALDKPFERQRIEVAGASIELFCWGESGKPGLLLLHGSKAHAQWWQPVAALLSDDYRVASFSFSGMGGSDWRERYSIDQLAEEAWACAGAAGLFQTSARPVVAAHSFGGKVAALLADEMGEQLSGVIFVDAFILPGRMFGKLPPYNPRSYDSKADALERFRLFPEQPAPNLYAIDAVARTGLRRLGDAWGWCFDPDFLAKLDNRDGWDEARRALCRLAFVRGEESEVVLATDAELQRQHMRADTIFIDIPQAHHHIMIDQPQALAAAMKSIVSSWSC